MSGAGQDSQPMNDKAGACTGFVMSGMRQMDAASGDRVNDQA
jgi:hypothetical protein